MSSTIRAAAWLGVRYVWAALTLALLAALALFAAWHALRVVIWIVRQAGANV